MLWNEVRKENFWSRLLTSASWVYLCLGKELGCRAPIRKDGPHPVLGTVIPCRNATGITQERKSCPPIFPRVAYLLQAREQGQCYNYSEKGRLDGSWVLTSPYLLTAPVPHTVWYGPHMGTSWVVLITLCCCHGAFKPPFMATLFFWKFFFWPWVLSLPYSAKSWVHCQLAALHIQLSSVCRATSPCKRQVG